MTTASLADLRTDEARINSQVAEAEYTKRLTETCTAEDLTSSALKVRALIMKLTSETMVNVLMDAVEDVTDETLVHFKMTDCLLDLMRELANEIDELQLAMPEFGEYFKRGSKPRDLLTVSQWADRYRWLESGTNIPGRWKTSNTPYLREIMDDLSEHSPVRRVSFKKSSGVGGTEVMYNWIGYIMHHLQNKDMLVVVPTLELRSRSFNPRLAKMLDETPVLSDLTSKATRSKANREDLLEYGARARIIKAGANSPDSLRSDHVPYNINDELDAFPWDVGGEGDPLTLIDNRQRTFSRAKSLDVSTPVDENESQIDKQYKRGDQRQCHVPCPHCGEYQVLKFGGKNEPYGLKWRLSKNSTPDDIQIEKAEYLCAHCGVLIDEGFKTDMLAKCRWIAQKPSQKLHHSYHINALYSPVGLGSTWKDIAKKWLEAQNDTAELKAFINTYLGEVFTEQGEEVDSSPLLLRKRLYADEPWIVITAFVDVQKDRLEIGFEGWRGYVKYSTDKDGKRIKTVTEENWKIEYIILPGDTADSAVWDELAETAKLYPIRTMGIDYGYNSSMVADFVKSHKYAVATKGYAGIRPLVEDERKRKQRLRVRRKKGVPVEPLGVDQGKSMIYSRLRNTTPGPGYVHFPDTSDFDEEYFEQLTAEKLVERKKGKRTIYEWVQKRARNEALDIAVGNLAMIKILNIDWEKEKKSKTTHAVEEPAKPLPRPGNTSNGYAPSDWSIE